MLDAVYYILKTRCLFYHYSCVYVCMSIKGGKLSYLSSSPPHSPIKFHPSHPHSSHPFTHLPPQQLHPNIISNQRLNVILMKYETCFESTVPMLLHFQFQGFSGLFFWDKWPPVPLLLWISPQLVPLVQMQNLICFIVYT